MGLTPPAAWENATPIFGIRYPKPTAPAKYLPDMFQHTGVDVEQAIIDSGAVPPALAYRTGTNAQRLAATPTKDLVWVETDSAPVGAQYIGTGTAWISLSQGSGAGWTLITAFGSGWTAVAADPPRVRLIGDQVICEGAINAATGFDTTRLFTVPAGFTLIGTYATVNAGTVMSNGNVPGMLAIVSPDQRITMRGTPAFGTSFTLYLSISWMRN